MLVVKVFVNTQQIDEIHIQNVGYKGGDFYNYKIRKPDIEDEFIVHNKSKGWMPLVVSTLKYLLRKEKR